MKKLLACVVTLVLVSGYAGASVVTWNAEGIFNNIVGLAGFTDDWDGAGWWIEIWDGSDVWNPHGPNDPTKTANNTDYTMGYYDYDAFFPGVGGESYGIDNFDFDSYTGSTVSLRLFDSADGPSAATPYYMITSQAVTLHSDPINTEDFEVAFDFTGQDWQPVPEPGTLALLGLGLAAIVARRRKTAA